MIIAEMPPADVPVEILCLHVKGEDVGSSRRKLLDISSTASPLRSVRVALVSFVAIVLFSFQVNGLIFNEALFLCTYRLKLA
jgi:hypothetical protein